MGGILVVLAIQFVSQCYININASRLMYLYEATDLLI